MTTEETKTPVYDLLEQWEKDIIDYYMNVKRKKVWAYVNGLFPGGKRDIDYNYDSCRTDSSKFFARSNIKGALKEKFSVIFDERNDLKGEILEELRALGFADVSNIFDFENGIQIKDLFEEDTRAIKGIKVKRETTKIIKSGEEETKIDIIQIDLHDKKAALSEMAEILALKRMPVDLTIPNIKLIIENAGTGTKD